MKEKQKVAIFEFDNAMIKDDSYRLFLRYLRGDMLSSIVESIAAMPWKVASGVGLCDSRKSRERMLTMSMGKKSKKKIQAKCRDFVDVLNKSVSGVALQKMQQMRNEGYRIVMVGDTLAAIIRPWAMQYGISDVVGIELEYNKKEVFTGRFVADKGESVADRITAVVPEIGECEVVAFGNDEMEEVVHEIADECIAL